MSTFLFRLTFSGRKSESESLLAMANCRQLQIVASVRFSRENQPTRVRTCREDREPLRSECARGESYNLLLMSKSVHNDTWWACPSYSGCDSEIEFPLDAGCKRQGELNFELT